MSTPATTSTAVRRSARKPPHKPPTARSLGQGLSSQGHQRAAVILESLAGERTAQQAAAALGMTVTNFYLLERKALQGLLRACEPQPKGPPKPGLERKLAHLERELARSQRECQRQAALVRATQRALGLTPPPVRDAKSASTTNRTTLRQKKRLADPRSRAEASSAPRHDGFLVLDG